MNSAPEVQFVDNELFGIYLIVDCFDYDLQCWYGLISHFQFIVYCVSIYHLLSFLCGQLLQDVMKDIVIQNTRALPGGHVSPNISQGWRRGMDPRGGT
jgi:hypothetical protein